MREHGLGEALFRLRAGCVGHSFDATLHVRDVRSLRAGANPRPQGVAVTALRFASRTLPCSGDRVEHVADSLVKVCKEVQHVQSPPDLTRRALLVALTGCSHWLIVKRGASGSRPGFRVPGDVSTSIDLCVSRRGTGGASWRGSWALNRNHAARLGNTPGGNEDTITRWHQRRPRHETQGTAFAAGPPLSPSKASPGAPPFLATPPDGAAPPKAHAQKYLGHRQRNGYGVTQEKTPAQSTLSRAIRRSEAGR